VNNRRRSKSTKGKRNKGIDMQEGRRYEKNFDDVIKMNLPYTNISFSSFLYDVVLFE